MVKFCSLLESLIEVWAYAKAVKSSSTHKKSALLDARDSIWSRTSFRHYIFVIYNRDLKKIDEQSLKSNGTDDVKLKPYPIRISIIDEAHNWAHGNNGAEGFKEHFLPISKNVLLMTATPLQLGIDDLRNIIHLRTREDEKSKIKTEGLLQKGGMLEKVTGAQNEVVEAIEALHPEDEQFIHALKEKIDVDRTNQVEVWEEAEKNPAFPERIRALAHALIAFRKLLTEDFQNSLARIMMKQPPERSRRRRYFCGKDALTLLSDAPDLLKGKDAFYPTEGLPNPTALLNFVCMRMATFTAEDGGNPRLMLGLTSSFEAFYGSREGQDLLQLEKGRRGGYVRDFLGLLKPSPLATQASSCEDEEGRQCLPVHPKVEFSASLIYRNMIDRGEKTVAFCEWQGTVKAIEERVKAKLDAFCNKCTAQMNLVELFKSALGIGIPDYPKFVRKEENQAKVVAALEAAAKAVFGEAFPGIPWTLDQTQKGFDVRPYLSIHFAAEKITRWIEDMDAADAKKTAKRAVAEAALTFLSPRSDDSDRFDEDGRSVISVIGKITGRTKANRTAILESFASAGLPAVLVCTPVSQEGVDMHRYCRSIILHDLNWNPAKLEQRIGRVDREGSLARAKDQDVVVAVPFLAQSYDEYQYQVVLQRADLQDYVFGRKDWVVREQTDKKSRSAKRGIDTIDNINSVDQDAQDLSEEAQAGFTTPADEAEEL